MKIAIVSPFPPSTGTLNEYAYHLVQHLSEKPDVEEIVIITDKLPDQKEYELPDFKVPVSFQDVWEFNKLTNPVQILRAIYKSQPDIVFYNLQFLSFGDKKVSAALGLLIPFLSKLMGFPSVVLLHNITETVDLESAGITSNPVLKFIFAMTGTLLTKVLLGANLLTVTISKYVKVLERKYKAKNVALVPHGSFELPPIPDFENGQGMKQVMAFGKFGTYKKVEEMIEAVDLLRKRHNERIEIVIAGSDSPNVKGYLESVAKQYQDMADLVFTGYVAEDDVPRIFRESTVVVFPYTSTTGSSGVLHQAGSYGKPAVLPDIGDLKHLVREEGYSGEFFLPGKVEDLTGAIERVLYDESNRISLSRANYAAAAALPMADIADWYLMHFKSLIKKKKRATVRNIPWRSFWPTAQEEIVPAGM